MTDTTMDTVPAMDAVLEIRGLRKGFPGFTLDGISLSLPKGYIMGLVGPNGAGKTTTIQLILNMLEKDAGDVLIFGKDHIASESAVKQDIGVVFDSIFYVDSWTVRDTEKAVSMFYDDWKPGIFAAMAARFGLPPEKKVGELSRGMQMKLMLACAFSHDAKLLILDEPTSGLDPVSRDEFLDILQEYIEDGEHSVLFSTHITSDLERVADYITLISSGRLAYTGSMEGLLGRYRLIKGRPQDLTAELEQCVLGLRKAGTGFTGLIGTEDAARYGGCVIEPATIDSIVIALARGERDGQ